MSESEQFLKHINRSAFDLTPFQEITPKPWGRELNLARATDPYMFKIIENTMEHALAFRLTTRKPRHGPSSVAVAASSLRTRMVTYRKSSLNRVNR